MTRYTTTYYPTPAELAHQILDDHTDLSDRSGTGMRILEPSAGTGNLTDVIRDHDHRALLIAVEPNTDRAAAITSAHVINATFENFADRWDGPGFHYVIANPPFAIPGNPELWIDHLFLGWNLLAPGGRLLLIAPAGYTFRNERRHPEARALIEAHGGHQPLPDNAFRDSGTNLRTVLLWADKPGDYDQDDPEQRLNAGRRALASYQYQPPTPVTREIFLDNAQPAPAQKITTTGRRVLTLPGRPALRIGVQADDYGTVTYRFSGQRATGALELRPSWRDNDFNPQPEHVTIRLGVTGPQWEGDSRRPSLPEINGVTIYGQTSSIHLADYLQRETSGQYLDFDRIGGGDLSKPTRSYLNQIITAILTDYQQRPETPQERHAMATRTAEHRHTQLTKGRVAQARQRLQDAQGDLDILTQAAEAIAELIPQPAHQQ